MRPAFRFAADAIHHAFASLRATHYLSARRAGDTFMRRLSCLSLPACLFSPMDVAAAMLRTRLDADYFFELLPLSCTPAGAGGHAMPQRKSRARRGDSEAHHQISATP